MTEKKAVEMKIDKGALLINVDSNKDGENSLRCRVDLGEAFQEAFNKGAAIEGAKVAEFKFEMTRLILKLDTDKDGEPVLELEIDLGEAFDEIKDLFSKKDAE